MGIGIIARAAVGVLVTFWTLKNFVTALRAIIDFADTVLALDGPVDEERGASRVRARRRLRRR